MCFRYSVLAGATGARLRKRMLGFYLVITNLLHILSNARLKGRLVNYSEARA